MNDTPVSAPVVAAEEEPDVSPDHRIPLQVTLMQGDITQVDVPIVMAGHYKGVAPIAAVGALDKALDYWISKACDRGMMGGDLGELFFIPVFQNQVGARAVLLAGMGEYGKFTYDSLCYLMMNVAFGVSDLAEEKFASVLVGSGVGGLSLEDSLKGALSGICDGLHHHVPEKRLLKEFVLIERDSERHKQMWETLQTYAEKQPIGNLQILIRQSDVPTVAVTPKTSGTRSASSRPASSHFVNRVTIERSSEGYQFSALVDSAVVPVRKVEVQPFFADGIAERLRMVSDTERQVEFARLLHTYVFPEDFERLIANRHPVPGEEQIDQFRPLTLILDSTTAALPWEMACFASSQQPRIYFGTDLKLTRQFRTMLSGAPGIAPPVNKTLKVLVIADPAPGDLHLDGAREEGEKVVEVLESLKQELKDRSNIDVEVEPRLGPLRCNPIDILSLIFNRTFDVIHFCGHGIFNAKYPNRSGWVFSDACILSAREIFRMRQVPRLVFANACFSAVVSEKRRVTPKSKEVPEVSAEETSRKLAGLAEAFFERGVQNYIGTGWKVKDSAASQFAETFYKNAVRGELIGDALSVARQSIFDQGSTWGAYQQYGQSSVRLTPTED